MPDSPAKISSLYIGIAESISPDPPKSPTPRPSRSFDDGAVGLGIVAAMIGPGLGGAPARSGPIQIVYARPAAKWGLPIPTKEEDMEMSECYTCVISLVGGKPVRKRVYFDDGGGGGGGCKGDPRVFCVSLPPVELALPSPVGDFLSRCCMCRKDLYGLDIFMYRGDKAFCSVECRSQQIVSDEHMENRGSKAMMKPHFDCSLSPCSAPLFFSAGVAAA